MQLSIIVPVYNVQEYLSECLESLVALDIDKYEIIVIDDGSTDNSKEVMEFYEKKYSNLINIYFQKNSGLSATRNRGINLAKGDYVVFIDSDDYIFKNQFQNIWNEVEIYKSDVCVGNLARITDGVITNDLPPSRISNKLIQRKNIDGNEYMSLSYDYVTNDFKVEAVTKFYKKSFLIDNNLYFREGILHEDTLFFMRTMLEAKTVSYFNEVFYGYRMRSGSIMHSINKKNYISVWKIALELYDLLHMVSKEAMIPYCSMIVNLIYEASKLDGVVEYGKTKGILNDMKRLTIKATIKKKMLLLSIRKLNNEKK